MAEPAATELDHLRILEVLSCHEVRHVAIGGMAAVLHGSLLASSDIDSRLPELRRLQQLRAAEQEGTGGGAPG